MSKNDCPTPAKQSLAKVSCKAMVIASALILCGSVNASFAYKPATKPAAQHSQHRKASRKSAAAHKHTASLTAHKPQAEERFTPPPAEHSQVQQIVGPASSQLPGAPSYKGYNREGAGYAAPTHEGASTKGLSTTGPGYAAPNREGASTKAPSRDGDRNAGPGYLGSGHESPAH